MPVPTPKIDEDLVRACIEQAQGRHIYWIVGIVREYRRSVEMNRLLHEDDKLISLFKSLEDTLRGFLVSTQQEQKNK